MPSRLHGMLKSNEAGRYEMAHYMRNRRKGKYGIVVFKLDMSKAYDRMECTFFEKIMRMGFEKLIRLLMMCVTTVSYKIKVNGEYIETIWPKRGLRQRDPLSPYLFIICADFFFAVMEDIVRGYN